MARRRNDGFDPNQLAALVRAFRGLPLAAQVGIAVAGGVLLLAYLAGAFGGRFGGPPPSASVPPGAYQFCFWNVENLFDDTDDKRNTIDDPYDNWFATDVADRQLKYDHLSDALLRLNGGRGPDVLACCEVESTRAAELLRDALNAKLPTDALKYTHVAMKDLSGGRHIAPCLITRLAVDPDRVRLHGRGLRILEAHVVANGHDLCVVASHWTSQLRGGEDGRDNYARTITGVYSEQMRANPRADFLVCGDFNTTPDDETVTGTLRMVGDRARVQPTAADPLLYNLLAGKPPESFGTHTYERKPLVYDQVGVSAGLLDGDGWGCDPNSVAVPTDGLMRAGGTRREPWRFGGPKAPPTGGRGYADHFPVTLTLTVAP